MHRPALRPTRRSVLLSTALMGSLALAGCEQQDMPWSSRTRALVTLAPLTTAAELVLDTPALGTAHAVSARKGHPFALLVESRRSRERVLHVATAEDPNAGTVPIAPETTTITVDDLTETVRVYAGRVVDGKRTTTLHTSTDLTDWTTTELGTEAQGSLHAAGSGLLIRRTSETEFQVHEVAEDGTLTTLSPITVPDGEKWSVSDIARRDDVITALVQVTAGEDGTEPALLRSPDSGKSWGGPAALISSGEDPSAGGLRIVNKDLVVLGEHDVIPEWNPTVSFRRPVAWNSTDGLLGNEEEIPLPHWGIENFTSDDRGALTPDTPMDFANLSSGPSISGEKGAIHLQVFYGDDARAATRSADGTWTISDDRDYTSNRIGTIVSDGSGRVYTEPTGIRSQSGKGLPAEGPGLEAASTITAPGAAGDGTLAGAVRRTIDTATRNPSHIAWGTRTENKTFAVDGDRLVPGDEPAHVADWDDLRIGDLPDGGTLLTGTPQDAPNLKAWVRLDGTWAEAEGLGADGLEVTGAPVSTSTGILLPARTPRPKEVGYAPVLLSSEDGLTWDTLAEADTATWKDDNAAYGAYLEGVTEIDGTVVGIGGIFDMIGKGRAVTWLLSDTTMTSQTIEDAPAGSGMTTVATVDGKAIALGDWPSDEVQFSLAADGTTSQITEDTVDQHRDLPLDLGEGLQIATGWIDRARSDEDDDDDESRGIGACIWATNDGGEHWDATMIPGQEGRFPDMHLLREGEDSVVVLVEDPDTVHGYRIAGVTADVRGDDA